VTHLLKKAGQVMAEKNERVARSKRGSFDRPSAARDQRDQIGLQKRNDQNFPKTPKNVTNLGNFLNILAIHHEIKDSIMFVKYFKILKVNYYT
jgi:hypothetical protein